MDTPLEISVEDTMSVIGSLVLIGVGAYLFIKLGYKLPIWIKNGYDRVKEELIKQKALQEQRQREAAKETTTQQEEAA